MNGLVNKKNTHMKDIYNIFEEEKLEDLKGVKDIDVDDADIINYLKENPDELKKNY